MRNNNFGQEAVEFILITILVFFGALFTIVIFGNKISSFFTSDSAVSKTTKNAATILDTSTQPKYSADYDTKTSTTPDYYGQYNAKTNEDGSITFKVGEQDVSLPKTVVDNYNTVLQTTGSSGINELINEIAQMVKVHASEYPAGQVPVQVAFGTGTREKATANYTGTASANIVNIQVGNSMVVIQNDQACTGSSCKDANVGKYRLEGTIGTDNTYSAAVQFVKDPSSNSYTKAGSFSNATITTNPDGTIKLDGTYGTGNGDWEFNFSQAPVSL